MQITCNFRKFEEAIEERQTMGQSSGFLLVLSFPLFIGLSVSQQCEDLPVIIPVGSKKFLCNGIANTKRYKCYDPIIKDSCCRSCERVKNETIGCEYGNRNPNWCTRSEQEVCPLDDFRANCCEKCKKYIEAVGCADKMDRVKIRSDEMSCPDMAERETPFCYDKFFQDLCCASCEKKKTNIPGCLYGDKNLVFCKTQKARDCYNSKDTCCKTCAAFQTGQQGCEFGDRGTINCNLVTPKQCEESPFHRRECCKTCQSIVSGRMNNSNKNENSEETSLATDSPEEITTLSEYDEVTTE